MSGHRAPQRGPAGHGGAGRMPGERPAQFGPTVRRVIGELRDQRARIITGFVLGGMGVILNAAGPMLLGRATDIVVDGMLGGAGVDFAALARVLVLVSGVYAVGATSMWAQGVLTTVAVQRTLNMMRLNLQRKLSRVPLSYVDARQRGELLSRMTNDVDNLAQTLQQTLSQLITAVLTILSVLTMMIIISPLLALVAVVTVPLSGFIVAQIARRSQPEFIEQWRRTGTLNGHVEEMYTGHALVTVFGHERTAQETFASENQALYQASYRAQFITGIIQPVMGMMSNIGYVLVAVIGGLRVISGHLSIGEVQAFVQYSRQFGQPITQIAGMLNLLQSGAASAERIFEVLSAPEESTDPHVSAEESIPEQVRGHVEFRDISFRYREDTPLIESLSLVAEPGQTVAIVGPTGAGKTTLVNLLMRFYEVDGGQITLDGVDIATVPRAQVRSNIGMVLQDTWLYSGTIEENITYGVDTEVGHEELVAAARATHVDPFVRTLAHGYQTQIDDEGVRGTAVSAGEKQLLTIARAFLADPPILILDEATSSVDTRTEALVQEAMGALRQGRTSFVIAHRLSTIRDADVILVMESGSIVEQGNHDELLAAGGAYARLYESQFAAGAQVGESE
ncbi:ABC transporter ATP-binding protein [Pseudactinotalea sp. Z1748]|uniref:ABC transporter ATP-binding protein n=1 Tax=Pseudactinotalea sp. Z1748 TaxID=3413027 RepID=UPI003C7BE0EC